jgi:hypothetical protein
MARSRYPRKGHRLAPAALGEILDAPVRTKHPAVKQRAGLRLCDLDERAWKWFPEEVCRQLAGEVVGAVAAAVRSPIPIGRRPLPAIPEGLTLADLDLEVRTINCLVAAGIHERPQDLGAMTIEGALGLRGFWAKSLVDLLTAVEYVIDHPEARRPRRSDAIVAIKHLRAAHRYPRPGHLLAPRTLKELLLERVPARLVRNTPLRGARLCDLDESVWQHLSSGAIAQLASLIVQRAGLAVHNRTVLQRRLPRPPQGMRLEDLRLENRTHNCLVREGFDKRPGGLGDLTVGEILSIPAFGTKCLVDLLTSLESRAAREGKLDKALTAAARALRKLPEAPEIHFNDPRLGPRLRLMDSESSTLAEMAERIVRRRLDPPEAERLARQLRDLGKWIERLRRLPVEEELAEVFAPPTGRRDREIVAEYYGWDGRGGRTLEQLARKHRLSRERIRQICVRAVTRARGVRVFAPALDRAVAFLSKRFPETLDRLQAEFDASGISSCGLGIEAVRQAAEFLGRPIPLAVIDLGRRRLAVHPRQRKIPAAVLRAARQVVANYGAATVRQVRAALGSRTGARSQYPLIRAVLDALPEFEWLDPQRLWFCVRLAPHHGLGGMIEKVLAVAERIELGKLRRALARYRRSARRLPPRRALGEFCRRMPGVRVEGGKVIAAQPRDAAKSLSGVERGMVDVLRGHGPVLDRGAFEQCCVERGVNRFSFNAALMSSPVIEQFGRSIYGLVGTRVSRRALAKLRRCGAAAPAGRVLCGFREAGDGTLHLAYRLSKAAISGGVVTVPAAVARRLRGRFTLRDERGGAVGTFVAKNGCGWGLGPALRGLGVRPGDVLLLSFAPARREALLRVGGEALLDAVARQCSNA